MKYKLINNIKYGMLYYSVAMFFIIAIQLTYFQLMPISNWFVYYEIKPEKKQFCIGEELYFKSDAEFKRKSNVVWNDILKCDTNGDGKYSFISSYESSSSNIQPKERSFLNNAPWRYGSGVPNLQTECFLESTQELRHSFLESKKTKPIISESFEIIECYEE